MQLFSSPGDEGGFNIPTTELRFVTRLLLYLCTCTGLSFCFAYRSVFGLISVFFVTFDVVWLQVSETQMANSSFFWSCHESRRNVMQYVGSSCGDWWFCVRKVGSRVLIGAVTGGTSQRAAGTRFMLFTSLCFSVSRSRWTHARTHEMCRVVSAGTSSYPSRMMLRARQTRYHRIHHQQQYHCPSLRHRGNWT
jgi:hypothetical protein